MKSGNRSNALLVELLIVVLFFMLAATVLLQVFSTARNLSAQSGRLAQALTEAQNVAERLVAAGEPEAELSRLGFQKQDDRWLLSGEEFDTVVTLSAEDMPYGVMLRQQIQVLREGEQLLSLPVSRYQEVRP